MNKLFLALCLSLMVSTPAHCLSLKAVKAKAISVSTVLADIALAAPAVASAAFKCGLAEAETEFGTFVTDVKAAVKK